MLALAGILGATAKESFVPVPDGVHPGVVALVEKVAAPPAAGGFMDSDILVRRAGCARHPAMEDHPRLSLAPALRPGDARQYRVPGALPQLVSRPQLLVHLLLAAAARAVPAEPPAAELAHCDGGHLRHRLRSGCLLWRRTGDHPPGAVQHRRAASE